MFELYVVIEIVNKFTFITICHYIKFFIECFTNQFYESKQILKILCTAAELWKKSCLLSLIELF
jgi:hypothetical protein